MVCPLRFGVFGISAVIALFAVLFTWASHCSGEQHPPAQPTAKRKPNEQSAGGVLLDMLTGKYLADTILNLAARSSN